MGNRIEQAKSGRARCVTCNEAIAKGGVRLAEETRDIGIPDLIHRFYHLRCAAAVHPELVANALQHVAEGVVFDRAEIEAKIAPAIERATEQRKAKYLAIQAEKEAKVKAISMPVDDTTVELLDQLAADPDDPGTLAVVADQLQARGDIRGELIALQLANAAGASPALDLQGDDDEETDVSDRVTDVERRSRRIAELMEKLAIPLDPGDRCVWGTGFVRRLELLNKNGTRLAALAPIWTHPSLRLLSQLKLTFSSTQDAAFIQRLPELLPKHLRSLSIGDVASHSLAGTAALIAALPRLETLGLGGRLGDDRLAHPTLRRLELCLDMRYPETDLVNLLPRLAAKPLPGVVEIAIKPCLSVIDNIYTDDTLANAVTALAANRWWKQLTHFAWIGPGRPSTTRPTALAESDVDALASALGKRKLARLDLTAMPVPLALREKLAKLCRELVAPNLAVADDETVYVEHVNKPEWGRGKLVRKHEGKVEIEFAKPVGKKVFKADAPFLKLLA